MEDPVITPEMFDMLQEEQEDEAADAEADRQMTQQEIMDAMGYPTAEEKQNQHSYLHKATFDHEDSIRTTYLTESELGRPLFSIRFLLDMEGVSKYYLDKIAKDLDVINEISNYFRKKTYNVTNSGMSNEGFAMNLNVTKKMDATRRRVRNVIDNLKGGEKKK